MEVFKVTNNRKSNVSDTISDKQAVRKNLPREFDHELANDPLSAAERANNKKTKKRQ
ncbi:small acid-soluble spore protein O [Lysinibacillus composti]|uniref:Small acid-soluble spore protein O n=1 Tax=Lysinibacillus composti TaxID=720633 RepID=A0A3N9UJ27_9BACI|nr:small acid-soluble spore protein O [Lysinibacillus composti]